MKTATADGNIEEVVAIPPKSSRAAFPAARRTPIVMERAVTGRVKWFNFVKGYGFITRDDGDADVFVHASAIVRKVNFPLALVEGQKLEFDIVDGFKGREATTVSGPGGMRVGTVVHPTFQQQQQPQQQRGGGGYNRHGLGMNNSPRYGAGGGGPPRNNGGVRNLPFGRNDNRHAEAPANNGNNGNNEKKAGKDGGDCAVGQQKEAAATEPTVDDGKRGEVVTAAESE